MRKIYTKIGDKGHTTFGCGIVQKNDPHIEAVGALDELNTTIGLSLCFIQDDKLRSILSKIQNDLFIVGADIGEGKLQDQTVPRINQAHITEIEKRIDVLQEKLSVQKKFILPGGTIASSYLHLCRSTTRRVERILVGLNNVTKLNPYVLPFINRLSDFFFVLARSANKEFEVDEQQPIYKYFDDEDFDDSV